MHFYPRNCKSPIPNGSTIGRQRSIRNTELCTHKREREIERERGQENQPRISSTQAQIPQGSGINLIQRTRQQSSRRSILHTPPNDNKIPDCWKWGYKFIKGHLDNCPAKKTVCNICKKIGYYAKVCRSEIPPRRSEIYTQNSQRNNPNHNYNRIQQQNTSQQVNARRVRNIRESNPENETI